MIVKTDVIIIGSGVSSLQAARFLSAQYDVHIITKAEITSSSSYKAQGGIAAVTSSTDSTAAHVQDTIVAGEFHHENQNVQTLIEYGKEAVEQLINEHFPFDRDSEGNLSIGMEGAHSKARIVHSGGDATGKALVDFLLEKMPKNVNIHEHELAYELLLNTDGECIGVKTKSNFSENIYLASYVIIATGGLGAIYSCTSNCKNSFGDGIALAYLAGAQVTDMEFIQFHPSLLYVNGDARGLISEAVRGAGAFFVKENGERLMKGVHPLEDLAPRHVTAFEVYKERANGNEVYLNISMIDDFERKFPTITALCKQNKIDIADGKIPVAPGSHFLMGGILADSCGRTTIPRLFAIGEVTCTGVHGANRLASNSLLEGITFSKQMALHLLEEGSLQTNFTLKKNKVRSNNVTLLPKSDIQRKMLTNAFVLRDSEQLASLAEQLPAFDDVLDVNLSSLSKDRTEQFFMNVVSSLIVNAALVREESRGSHIRKDFPLPKDECQNRWIVFEKGTMNVRNGLYEQTKASRHVETVFL